MAYSIPNTLNKFIRRDKDKIDSMSQNNCVYKISCFNCDWYYVCETNKKTFGNV